MSHQSITQILSPVKGDTNLLSTILGEKTDPLIRNRSRKRLMRRGQGPSTPLLAVVCVHEQHRLL